MLLVPVVHIKHDQVLIMSSETPTKLLWDLYDVTERGSQHVANRFNAVLKWEELKLFRSQDQRKKDYFEL